MSIGTATPSSRQAALDALKSVKLQPQTVQVDATHGSSNAGANAVVVLAPGVTVTQAELQRILGPNEKWPHRAAESGWMLIHDAIRDDMDEIQAALAATVKQLKAGRALFPWQVSAWKTYYNEFYRAVHHHHDAEEAIVFPWLATRVTMPDKMSSDHVTLMEAMNRCRSLVDSLRPNQPASDDLQAIHELAVTFDSLRTMMREHLAEEDDVGVPLMRMFFSREDEKVTEKEILKQVTPGDLGYLLRTRKTDKERRELLGWMSIPAFVQVLFLLPAVRKYNRTMIALVKDLQAGERTQRSGFFWLPWRRQ